MENKIKILVAFFCAALMATDAKAQNPISQTRFTTNPAPMVNHDTVFLYTVYDDEDAFGFKMQNWLLQFVCFPTHFHQRKCGMRIPSEIWFR